MFALGERDAERLLARISAAGLALFHVRMPASFGFTQAGEPAAGEPFGRGAPLRG